MQNQITVNNSSSRYTELIFLAVPALFLLYFLWSLGNAPYSDYAGYYFGGRAMLKGGYRTVYDTYLFNALIENQGYKGIFVSYSPFPPFTAVVMAPFTSFFSPHTSRLLFTAFSSLFFLFTLYRSVR